MSKNTPEKGEGSLEDSDTNEHLETTATELLLQKSDKDEMLPTSSKEKSDKTSRSSENLSKSEDSVVLLDNIHISDGKADVNNEDSGDEYTCDDIDIADRVNDQSQSILDLQVKSELGAEFHSDHNLRRRKGFSKYKGHLMCISPVRFSKKKDLGFHQSGCFSLATYSWLSSLLWAIYKKGVDFLEEVQIGHSETSHHNAERMEKAWNEELRIRGCEKASYFRTVIRFAKKRVILICTLLCIQQLLSFCSPAFVLLNLLRMLQMPSEQFVVWKALLLLLLMVICEISRSWLFGLMWLVSYQAGLSAKTGSLAFLFKKILNLRNLKDKTNGELINMCSNDGQRVFDAIAVGPLVVSAPLMFICCLIFSVWLLGPWGLIACGTFLLFYPVMMMITKLIAYFRRKCIVITDKRVRKMTEFLSCIKLIKMYAWEKSFAKEIANVRDSERRLLQKTAFVQSFSNTVSPMVPMFASVFTFLAIVLSGNKLSASDAFSFIAVLNAMRLTIGVVPFSLSAIANMKVASERYKNVLILGDIKALGNDIQDDQNCVELKSCSFAWDSVKKEKDETPMCAGVNGTAVHENADGDAAKETETMIEDTGKLEPDLYDIDFNLKKGKIVGVCGSVGAGKSSLISAIIGRMVLLSGRAAVKGSIAYVSQQAWIMNSTARENILFGKEYEEEKYKAAVESCCLQADFETIAAGDMTEIGERGVNLSGGQKQRISLARAVYNDAEIYLLDDPLSAVDIHVGRHIFDQCLQKCLKGKTVLFVTHQLQYLDQCDEVLFIKNGRIVETGTHDELMASEGEYSNLIKVYYTEHKEVQEVEEMTEEERELMDNSDFNKTTGSLLERQLSHSTGARSPMDKFLERQLSVRSNKEFQRGISVMSVTSNQSVQPGAGAKLIVTEEREQGSVDLKLYLTYARSAGGILFCCFVFFTFLISIASQTFSVLWLSLWLDLKIENQNMTANETQIIPNISDHPESNIYALVYGLFAVLMVLTTCIRGLTFMKATLTASSNLHDKVFIKILSSPMQFFDTNPVGRIVNRFSADMDELDVRLPITFEIFLQNIFMILLSISMIAYVLPYFMICLIPVALFFIFLTKMFVKIVRELKRLDNVWRSPVISHLTASVNGIATIDAYGKREEFLRKFEELLDRNTLPFFLFYTSNRWLAIRLDVVSVTVISVAGITAILTQSVLTPATAGLALSFAIQITGLFQFTVRLAIDTEAKFVSVQRLLSYITSIEKEEVTADIKPEDRWPSEGKITFKNYSMRYREGLPYALRGVTFSVHAQEKLGIVGRSGSGKSSLGVGLFRLVEAAKGSIEVDGIDISKINLEALRSKLAIIPQDPVLFVGTVRYNLDPFNQHSDADIWQSLEKCHIKDTISGLEKQLESPVVENGENFSVGERQLMCLARALLRNSKILVLDEATAAIDTRTDALVQMTIKEAFADCTMLVIAHRLNTVLSSHRVLVMEDGKVAEFDKPSVLMSRENSKFKSMLEATEGQADV